MKDKLANLVKRKYSERIEQEDHELQKTRVSVEIPIADAILFNLIAEEFSQSRASLLSEVLDIAAHSLFSSLEDADKINIGSQADEQLADSLKEIYTKFEYSGSLKWGHFAIAQTVDPSTFELTSEKDGE